MAAAAHPIWLELIMPPWRRYQFASHATPDEAIAAMRAATEPRRRFRMPFAEARDFEGVVDDDRFAVSRIIGYRNSLRPLIRGRVEPAPGGSRVTIAMRPDWMALISVVTVLAIAITIVALVETGVGAVSGHPAAFGLSAAVIIGSYLMISIPFGLEARWADTMLRDILRAKEIPPAPAARIATSAYQPPLSARAPYVEAQRRDQTRIRRAFIAYLILVWIVGVAAFVSFRIVYGSGAPGPQGAQTVAMIDHGRIVYVTAHQKLVADGLRALMFGGIVSAILGALIIDRMLGVPLFSSSARRDGAFKPR